jgi:hypothetical protein
MDNTRKFVNWDVPNLEALKDSKAYQLRQRLNDGGKLNRSEKNWLTEAVNHNAYFKQSVPLQGWCFSFTDALRHYWVKQYGQITEYFAVDKTALRSILFGKIEQIVELKG